MRRRWVAVAALLLCACADQFSRREQLLAVVKEYNDGVRWNRLEQSAIHLAPSDRRHFADRHAPLADELEVTDYDVTRVEIDQKHDTATVVVDVQWSMKRRGLLERTVVEEKWSLHNGDWLLTRESRLRGAALPLYDEPEAKSAKAQ
jgi:hypothetical protein